MTSLSRPPTGVPVPAQPGGAGPAGGGYVVGGYALLTRIGEGGMGVVHLAQQPGGPRVALKVLRPHIVGDDEARARLAREVASLQRIRSPRVAEIVDADPWGPVPFVATRYVPGLSLHDHIHEEGPLTGRDLPWFAACLAEALTAVHNCGVLHRDIKPSNVLMEGRSPVLIDFGLARVADDPKLTHTGWLLGTPGYLAPEILYGDDASEASDVHSWAATVAFAGTGQPPFGRGPSMAIMDRVRRGEHRIDGLPEQMVPLIVAALDPEPARRPTLDQALAHLTSPPPTIAQPATEPATQPTPTRQQEPADPFTMPLAVAALATAERGTDAVSATPAPAPTRFETVYPIRPGTPPGERGLEAWELAPEPEPRAPLAERLRRATLSLALAGVVVGAILAWPALAVMAVVIVVWSLRSGSLAATAVSARRQLRGPRWYDGVQTLGATPWHLVRAIPATFMLVLWAGGLSLAGAMLGYAAWGLGERTRLLSILALAGALLAVAMWAGPGGSRVRGPLRRVINPLAAHPAVWLIATLLVAAIASGEVALAIQHGPTSAPFANPLGH